nr:unnamed protein product [Callosobruchus analis]
MDFDKMLVYIPELNMLLKCRFEGNEGQTLSINLLNTVSEKLEPARHMYSEAEVAKVVEISGRLNENEKKRLMSLISEFRTVFSETPGRMEVYEHEIVMRDESPFHQPSYPVPVCFKDAVKSQIKDMIQLGVISQCRTEYVSPLVVVRKKDESARVCIDARMLNKKMEGDAISPPHPEELLAKFNKSQFMSSLDMTAGYWQVPIRKEHRKYTGFLFEGITYCYNVLPFGLKTSVASFIRGLWKVFGPEFDEFLLLYVDDMLVYSRSVEDHFKHLKLIFQRLSECNLTIKLRKCAFARDRVEFLGHVITPDHIMIDPGRTDAIQKYPAPRNIRELRGFLGFINFERRFVRDFSDLTLPLLPLLKKNKQWHWGNSEHQAFINIKKAFLKVTFLTHPDFTKRFYVQCDSSGYAVGASLFQMGQDGERGFLAFASRTLRGPELRYTVTEKEALSIVFAFKHWRSIVLGQPLTVLTDHKALSFLMTLKLGNSRLTRWVLVLQEFDFQIEYCRGSDNVLADGLSRNPIPCSVACVPDNQTTVNLSLMKLVSKYPKVEAGLKSIKKDQESDVWIRSKIDVLRKQAEAGATFEPSVVEMKIIEWYSLYEGVLFRKGDTSDRGHKLCVPKNQVEELIQQQHAEIGHFGVKKTALFIKGSFYWPKMMKNIRRIVLSCELCQKSKVAKRTVGSVNTIVVDKPGRLVFLDLMGPLPRSVAGVVYLLAVVDGFTRYVLLYGLKKANARSVINRLKNDYFVKMGIPERILTDNATIFHAKLWKRELEGLSIKVSHTSVYFPEGNITERVNREIGRMLRAFCYEKHTKWAQYLGQIESCLNEVVHESTGFSPKFLHFGIQTNSRICEFINPPPNSDARQELTSMWVLAHKKLMTKAERKRTKRQGGLEVVFKEGDAVLVRQHPLSSAEDSIIKKFWLLYEGPFWVSKVINPNCYEVTDGDGLFAGRHNVKNLKKYIA